MTEQGSDLDLLRGNPACADNPGGLLVQVLAIELPIARLLNTQSESNSDFSLKTRAILCLMRLNFLFVHRRVIELDYGMTDGKLTVPCRQALLFYALKHLGLDHTTGASPKEHQIVLQNREDIKHLLAGGVG